jgi:tetratricopeptide (TPR) repeat protein
MEFLVVLAVFGYIYYLRNYADLRSKSEKETASLKDGIKLFNDGQIQPAFEYFDTKIKTRPKSSVAYLYRALCYKNMENNDAARKDLITGLSFDSTLPAMHLEKGKLEYESKMLKEALESFNKAVLYGGDHNQAPYRWRGLTHQALGLDAEAQKDFLKESDILKMKLAGENQIVPTKAPFWDKRLAANSILIVITSAIMIIQIKGSEGIHLPYFLAVASAISIGFVEPVKGWILAICQCIFLVAGYYLFTQIPENTGRQEIENFSLYGSCILTFAGSFIGGFFKRAISAG